ncbi:hypothetical protein BAE44_0012582, partial [Dichanthelium oligosanthes]
LVASQAAILIVRATAGFATLDPEAIPCEIAASAPCHCLRVDTVRPCRRRHGHSKDDCSHCPDEECKKRVPPH